MTLEIDGRSHWSICLYDNDATDVVLDNGFTAADVTVKEINVQRSENGYGREYTSYRLGADGIVRRHDVGDVWGDRQKRRAEGIPEHGTQLGWGASREEVVQAARENISQLINFTLPNQQFERQMGVNEQPISMQEFEDLRAMIDDPRVEVLKRH